MGKRYLGMINYIFGNSEIKTKRCSTCIHWQKPPEGEYDQVIYPTDEDEWEPKQMPFEVRYCKQPKLGRFERPVDEDGLAVIDGSQFYAALATSYNFGCINHEHSSDPIQKLPSPVHEQENEDGTNRADD